MQLQDRTFHDEALVGMLADIGPRDIATGLNEETDRLRFGLGVAQGASDAGCILPSATSDALVGITVHNQWRRGGIPAKGSCDVLKKGRIRVAPEQEVKPGDPVFWRVTGEGRGQFRRDDGTGPEQEEPVAIEIHEARWIKSGHPDLPAILDLNLP